MVYLEPFNTETASLNDLSTQRWWLQSGSVLNKTSPEHNCLWLPSGGCSVTTLGLPKGRFGHSPVQGWRSVSPSWAVQSYSGKEYSTCEGMPTPIVDFLSDGETEAS